MNYRVCLACQLPFTDTRQPYESRPVREYQTGRDVALRITAWGHVCGPCAIGERKNATTARNAP